MPLPWSKTELAAVPLDWSALARVLCEHAPSYGTALAAGRSGPGRQAMAQLPDDVLLSAAVHARRFGAACTAPAVARAMRDHPFRDWRTPWDAGRLMRVPSRALATVAERGGGDPVRTDRELRQLSRDAFELASFVEPRPESDAVTGEVACRLVVADLQQAAARRHARTEPLLHDYLPGSGPFDEPDALRWPGAPADWTASRWRWDRQWSPLRVGDVPGLEQTALLRPVAGRLQLSGRLGLAWGVGEPDLTEADYLEAVHDALDVELVGLALLLQEVPQPDGPVRTEPWTDEPWERLEVVVAVVPGGDVRVHRDGERALRVVLPVDPGRPVPFEELVLAFVEVTAATLLAVVPDLTPHAREVLAAEADGNPATVASVRGDVAAWAAGAGAVAP